jgi:hypothetical protein
LALEEAFSTHICFYDERMGYEEAGEFLLTRIKAGVDIDPDTAEVMWRDGPEYDPYGILPPYPEPVRRIRRHYYARRPGSDVWVAFTDLPLTTANALCNKHGIKRRESGEEIERDEFIRVRKVAGLRIDPDTAEVHWHYGLDLDPYGIEPDLPKEYWQIGRQRFARSPDSDIWVHFHDLPVATRDALFKKHKKQICFPGGLEQVEQRLLS